MTIKMEEEETDITMEDTSTYILLILLLLTVARLLER